MDQRKRTSQAWAHFETVGRWGAKCNICNRIVSYKGGGPSNLLRHLKVKHTEMMGSVKSTKLLAITPAVVDEDDAVTKAPNQEDTITYKITVPQNIVLTKEPRELDKNLMNLFAKQYLPLNIIQSKEMKDFIKLLNPKYDLPSREKVSNELMVTFNEDSKRDIQQLLSRTSFVALSIDSWTSTTSLESYSTLSVHCMVAGKFVCHALACKPGEVLTATQIQDIATEWNIDGKVVALTSPCPVDFLKYSQIPCFAHILDEVMRNAVSLIDPLYGKVKDIVQLFRTIPKAGQLLIVRQEHMKKPELMVETDGGQGCWMSTRVMFQRVLDMNGSISEILKMYFPHQEPLNGDDILTLTGVCELMGYFKDAVTVLRGQGGFVTLSEVIPMHQNLLQQCSNCLLADHPYDVAQMAEIIISELTTRCDYLTVSHTEEFSNVAAECTILDPRFKQEVFKNEVIFEAAKAKLEESVIVVDEKPLADESDEDIWNEFDKRVNKSKETQRHFGEFDDYLGRDVILHHENPTQWWQRNKPQFPILYALWLQRNCIPATSIEADRWFTRAGQMYMERRNILSGPNDKIEQFICLNRNL